MKNDLLTVIKSWITLGIGWLPTQFDESIEVILNEYILGDGLICALSGNWRLMS